MESGEDQLFGGSDEDELLLNKIEADWSVLSNGPVHGARLDALLFILFGCPEKERAITIDSTDFSIGKLHKIDNHVFKIYLVDGLYR